MVGVRAALVAILGGVLVACSAGAPPLASPAASPTEAPSVAITAATASEANTASPPSPSPSPTPLPTLKPTPVSEPPTPTGVSFDKQVREIVAGQRDEVTYTVTWRAPRSEGVQIRVYGVTECLAEPTLPPAPSSGPCLVEHTPLPASVRTLLATAPASDRVVSWSWTTEGDCYIGLENDPNGPAYYAVVVAAFSASGHSDFVIAAPGSWVDPGPDGVVC